MGGRCSGRWLQYFAVSTCANSPAPTWPRRIVPFLLGAMRLHEVQCVGEAAEQREGERSRPDMGAGRA